MKLFDTKIDNVMFGMLIGAILVFILTVTCVQIQNLQNDALKHEANSLKLEVMKKCVADGRTDCDLTFVR